MIFSKRIVGNSRTAKDQWKEVELARNAANAKNEFHSKVMRNSGLTVNQGLVPADVYQDFDAQSVEVMQLDNGDVFLNDLLPMSRSVSIGKLVSKFRQSSTTSGVQSSMSGQIGLKLDQVEFSYDGAIVPIHDAGFSRKWREWQSMQSEGFDALIDDQRERIINVREHLADTFMDGVTDEQGNYIEVDTISWQGMRNDSRVVAVDLGVGDVNFDFTDASQTGDTIKENFIEVLDVMRITNKCNVPLNIYVSLEINSVWEKRYSENYDSMKIIKELADLRGVAKIEASNKLSGNQLMGFPASGGLVRPVVGMGLNTVAMSRPEYNSDYIFAVWAAIGWQVRNDYDGNGCAFYASA